MTRENKKRLERNQKYLITIVKQVVFNKYNVELKLKK